MKTFFVVIVLSIIAISTIGSSLGKSFAEKEAKHQAEIATIMR